MLIIGHRGSRGTHQENSLSSLREALRADVDMIEFDVRLTKDKVPVLCHSLRLYGTRKTELALLRRYTYAELQKRTAGSDHPILSLEKALDELFGTVILNIEVKERTAVNAVIKVSKKHVHKKSDWDKILFSSSKPLVLAAIRRKCPEAALAFLSRRGSLLFAVLHRAIDLSAVGFHRLYTSRLALHTAKELGLFTYAYTVNRSSAAKRLIDRGIDGIVTDYPAQLVESLRNKD